MPKIPYLAKRGHMFWWRRRKPVFILPQPSRGTETPCTDTDGAIVPVPGHFAVSLRTTCPKEAGRRAARMNLLFEEKRRSIEAVMSRGYGMSDQCYLDRAMADMAATLRAQAEMMARQMASPTPAPMAAQPQNPVAAQDPGATPAPAPAAKTGPRAKSRIDDPEFERAILEMAEREGWWHEDPDEIVEQFDMMLTGLFTVQEEYLRYCVRKGLDPAAALPSLAGLGKTLSSVTSAVQASAAAAVEAEEPGRSRGGGIVEANNAPRRRKSKDGRRFSDHARRFLDLRSEGYDLKRRHETPDTGSGGRFTRTSRGNFEGTVRLFLEAHGDIFVENIDENLLQNFFSLLDRIPSNHGKSSKDRRPIRQVIEETDREERNTIARRKAEMERDRLSTAEIEEILDTLHVDRLRTNTCKRHMDAMDQIMAFAQFEGLRTDNPVKQVKWTSKEIKRRLAHEEDRDRLPWGDRLPELLSSPIFRTPLEEPGDPGFWAPLLGLFAGFRMEEALQLRTDDFDTIDLPPAKSLTVM